MTLKHTFSIERPGANKYYDRYWDTLEQLVEAMIGLERTQSHVLMIPEDFHSLKDVDIEFIELFLKAMGAYILARPIICKEDRTVGMLLCYTPLQLEEWPEEYLELYELLENNIYYKLVKRDLKDLFENTLNLLTVK